MEIRDVLSSVVETRGPRIPPPYTPRFLFIRFQRVINSCKVGIGQGRVGQGKVGVKDSRGVVLWELCIACYILPRRGRGQGREGTGETYTETTTKLLVRGVKTTTYICHPCIIRRTFYHTIFEVIRVYNKVSIKPRLELRTN